jgi:hypothetical protein
MWLKVGPLGVVRSGSVPRLCQSTRHRFTGHNAAAGAPPLRRAPRDVGNSVQISANFPHPETLCGKWRTDTPPHVKSTLMITREPTRPRMIGHRSRCRVRRRSLLSPLPSWLEMLGSRSRTPPRAFAVGMIGYAAIFTTGCRPLRRRTLAATRTSPQCRWDW